VESEAATEIRQSQKPDWLKNMLLIEIYGKFDHAWCNSDKCVLVSGGETIRVSGTVKCRIFGDQYTDQILRVVGHLECSGWNCGESISGEFYVGARGCHITSFFDYLRNGRYGDHILPHCRTDTKLYFVTPKTQIEISGCKDSDDMFSIYERAKVQFRRLALMAIRLTENTRLNDTFVHTH